MSGVMEFALTEKYRRYASRRRIKSVLWLVCGSILMSAGFVLFMNPYQVVPGGVYGLGIVLHALFPSIQVGTFGLMFDIPLLLIGLKVFGRMFGAKTVTAALLIPVLMNTMTYFIGENPATMFGGKNGFEQRPVPGLHLRRRVDRCRTGHDHQDRSYLGRDGYRGDAAGQICAFFHSHAGCCWSIRSW